MSICTNIYPIININDTTVCTTALNDSDLDFYLNFKPDFLQIRMNLATCNEVVNLTKRVIRRRNQLGLLTKIIVNNHLEAALEAGADGLHLGQDDTWAGTVISEHPNLIVGLSTHSLRQIEIANTMNLSYIGFGPVFSTITKVTDCEPVLSYAADAVKLSKHPVVFIGGINIKNVDLLPKGEKVYLASIAGLADFAD